MSRDLETPSPHAELFLRHPANPILTAQGWPYRAHTVFNAGACRGGNETVLLVRVEDRRGHSHFTVARSNDGVSNRRRPRLGGGVPEAKGQPNGGGAGQRFPPGRGVGSLRARSGSFRPVLGHLGDPVF
jgi:hypothetical protein